MDHVIQDPDLIRLLLASVKWPRDTVWVLQSNESTLKWIIDTLAAFGTVVAFGFAIFEWRRANREERLRRKAEERARQSTDYAIGSSALGLVHEIEALLHDWNRILDPGHKLRDIQAGTFPQITKLVPEASPEIGHHFMVACQFFNGALDEWAKARGGTEDATRAVEHTKNLLQQSCRQLRSAVPTEIT